MILQPNQSAHSKKTIDKFNRVFLNHTELEIMDLLISFLDDSELEQFSDEYDQTDKRQVLIDTIESATEDEINEIYDATSSHF